MKILRGFAFCVLLLAGVNCQETPTTTSNPTETTPTATDPTTLETTTIADTTTNSDTTTTVAPTTAEAPSTTAPTTQSPTTTQKTTSTSTPTTTPSSTTPAPVTSTPAPVSSTTTKPPVAELGSWKVTENNVTCIRADLKIRFMIPVNGREEYIALSPNATSNVGSSCNSTNGTQELRLTDSDYVLLLTFERDDKIAYLKNISLTYSLPGDSDTAYNDSSLFKVKVGNSYLCTNTETVPLRNVSMEIFEIHLQSFGSSSNGDFGTAEECDADDKVNDIVPIAVGCCLLALVVIVLIAYFVGRRRSRQKGYQSV